MARTKETSKQAPGIDPALLSAAVERQRKILLSKCFSADDLDSRPYEKQWDIFNDMGKIRIRWVVAANQTGKSSIGAKELSWILNGDHPFWTRPKEWGTGPLRIIIAGKSRDILTLELWENKLKPLLTGNWQEVKKQGILVGIRNKDTDDYILLIPHGDGSEMTRGRLQGFVGHYVWCDEMPEEANIISELQMRIQSKQGYFLGTFTPLAVNSEIKHMVESSDGILSKRYQLCMLDNPLYHGREAEVLALANTWPVRERRARLYGEWFQSDSSVYEINRESVVVPMPHNYSSSWRHHVSVDPALGSETGLGVYAEDPGTGIWYCIKATYVREKDPDRLWVEIWKEVGEGLNVTTCSQDVAPWFQALALKNRRVFVQPYNKTQRKGELIKNLQAILSNGGLKLVAGMCGDLLDEFETCRYSSTGEEKIIGAQKYHLLDQCQYFVDTRPPMLEQPQQVVGRDEAIMRAFEKQQKQQSEARKYAERIALRRKRR